MHTHWCVLIEISVEIGMWNFWLGLLVTALMKETYFSGFSFNFLNCYHNLTTFESDFEFSSGMLLPCKQNGSRFYKLNSRRIGQISKPTGPSGPLDICKIYYSHFILEKCISTVLTFTYLFTFIKRKKKNEHENRSWVKKSSFSVLKIAVLWKWLGLSKWTEWWLLSQPNSRHTIFESVNFIEKSDLRRSRFSLLVTIVASLWFSSCIL